MEGFKLIRYTEGVRVYTVGFKYGLIDYKPEKKWRHKKQDPVDPTKYRKIGPYYQDEFKCTVYIDSEEYDILKAILTDDNGTLYIEYSHNSSVVQYPVNLVNLPECSDDMHDYRDKTSLKLESLYVTTPTPIDFTSETFIELDSEIIWI